MRSNPNRAAEATPEWAWLSATIHIITFTLGLLLYVFTAQGDVQPADSGEFQVAAFTLGIPHPPGYPLYTLLGWLFIQTFGVPLLGLSLLSAVAAAFTLLFVSLSVQAIVACAWRTWWGSTLGAVFGASAALTLAGSTTFWAQATTANIRSLTALFTALLIFASVAAWANPRPSALVAWALVFGLGVGHHASLAFVGSTLGVFVAWALWRAGALTKRAVALSLLALLVTQTVWLYLPLRDMAGARFAPGTLTTLEGFLWHVLARGFAGDMFAFTAPDALVNRLELVPTLLRFQFSDRMLLATGLTALVLLRQRRAHALALLAAWGAHLFITLTYRAPQTVEYALPCWVLMAVLLGAGAGSVVYDLSTKPLQAGTAFAVCGWVLVSAAEDLGARAGNFILLAQDRSVRGAAESTLRAAQPNSVILAQWHQATPMWALQEVEGIRRDVKVEYVFPRGAQPYPETFAQQAAAQVAQRTTYVTSFFAEAFSAAGVRALPVPGAPAWQVVTATAQHALPLPHRFDQRIDVGIVHLERQTVEIGQPFTVDLAWRRVGEAQLGDALTVRLMRPEGRLAANTDVQLDPKIPEGQTEFRRMQMAAPLDLPPGAYDLLVGAYRVDGGRFVNYQTEQGETFVAAARITVTAASIPLPTRHDFDAPLAEPETPELVGVDYDTGRPGQVRLWTHWRLGRSARRVVPMDASGQPLAASREVPTTTQPGVAQYVALPFDIPPTRQVWLEGRLLPAFAEGERYIPFANQMVLVGSGARRTSAALNVRLEWLSARVLTNDYIVSVRVAGEGLYRVHDGVPALGAIPTLKWIRYSRVTDIHPIDVGLHAGPFTCTVVVYDSTNRLTLPPLDERYDQGVTLSCP
ncbi:MAG: DUF2723 domain-containing protein [Thermoflexales bacterium]|nr:DUF2723 domain-containing protein [Thermoflexales bacterium]